MTSVYFTVDAALLRELGERLVGKPHVALAELIKNAYDADAKHVDLKVLDDRIEISDDGHGMDVHAFKNYWMRIGSPHKEAQRTSPDGRTLTGQKGVGRLAVQFLGRELEVLTKSGDDAKGLQAAVDWDEAIQAGDLTNIKIEYERATTANQFPEGSKQGTRLVIKRLSQAWDEEDLRRLALEIWALQPPFEDGGQLVDFRVRILDAPPILRESFTLYMNAFRMLWHARISGRLVPPRKPGEKGTCTITVQFEDKQKDQYTHQIDECSLQEMSFSIYIYSLTGRQPYGVKIGELRDYLQRFGGVGIYDGGFRLPYYGVDTDWLRVQLDHSRRLSHSELLPEEYRIQRGLNFLPTNSRILGAVHVNTADERYWNGEKRPPEDRPLEIAISRDRLIENKSFSVVRKAVRAALDFYAMREAARELKQAEVNRKTDRAESVVKHVAEVVERHAPSLPRKAVSEIKAAVQEATNAVQIEQDVHRKQANLLGALATAGIAAAALEHESARQLRGLERLARRLRAIASTARGAKGELERAAGELQEWIDESRSIRRVFTSMTEKESREDRHRLRARSLLQQVVERLGPFLRGVVVDLDSVDDEFRLPSATFVEWQGVFQNVFTNAVNATIDSRVRKIVVATRIQGVARSVLVQDTGAGVRAIAR